MHETPPVLFLIFNRRETALRTLARIREARPPQLFIAGDGPRPGRGDEATKCAETRSAVLGAIDWPCEVKTLLRDENLGCRRAVSGGLDWFFENVESGIVIEDDCVLSRSFFPFAAELLGRYRDDTRVFSICANCFPPRGFIKGASYYFTKHTHCWGWASWRRSWKLYADAHMQWDAFVANGGLVKINDGCPVFERHFIETWDNIANGKVDTWDFQWHAASWINGMLNVLPAVNMVCNTGWGEDSTHTSDSNSWTGKLPALEIDFPLVHPAVAERNTAADRWTDIHIYHIRHLQPLIRLLSRCGFLRFLYHKIFKFFHDK
jgi:hypothetical protein